MHLQKVIDVMNDFWQNSPLNIVAEINSLRIFDQPLVGVASAEDELFAKLKEEDVVGAQHMSPVEWLAGAQAVVGYFLPFTKAVREANRTMGLPAKEWLYGRIEGEQFNNAMRKFLVDYFTAQGYQAVSPALDERFTVVNRRSNWSERHVGFIAGLGTFSLSCSFITKAGSAGRMGSVIVNALLTPTERYYTVIDENCSKCGACIRRCPPLAITESGKDHAVCASYLDRVLARFKPRYGCGKCQTQVPCEAGIPRKSITT